MFMVAIYLVTLLPFVRLHQDCNHTAAVLFKMDAAWKAGATNPSCTSTSCTWKEPTTQRNVLDYCCVTEMNWDKPMYNRKGIH